MMNVSQVVLSKLNQVRFPYRSYLDKHKCIFIHIPKTGGTSILEVLGKKGIYGRDHMPWYVYERSNGRKFHSYFKFSVVRNPVDRLYSAYSYIKKGGNGKSDLNLVQRVSAYKDFEDFVLGGLGGGVLRSAKVFMPQHYYLLDDVGQVCVDCLIKFENLEEGFSIVADRLDLKKNLPKLNASSEQSFSNISVEVADKIYELYKPDFDAFGYKM